MKRFIEGADRDQSTLFPERLDDFIAENNPVRVVEAYVEALDLSELVLRASIRVQLAVRRTTHRYC